MKLSNTRQALLGAAAAIAVIGAPAILAAQSDKAERSQTFSGTLSSLNDSGVTGSFTIRQRGQGQITVDIQATGLEVTDQPHVGHIHGLDGNSEAMCPTLAQDDDGDGFIELAEGLDVYGGIILELGDVDPDNDGVVNYSKTFKLNKTGSFADGKDKDDLFPINLREIVLHGMTLEEGEGSNGGEADGTAGYKTVLPVACGAVE